MPFIHTCGCGRVLVQYEYGLRATFLAAARRDFARDVQSGSLQLAGQLSVAARSAVAGGRTCPSPSMAAATDALRSSTPLPLYGDVA